MRTALLLCLLPAMNGQDPGAQQPYPTQGPPVYQPGGPESDQQAPAEPDVAGPGVARISLISGDVSVRRGDSGEFVIAAMNAPLMVQDYLSTGPSGRAEVQFDYSNMVRLGAQTEVRFVQMDGGHYQMQIARGTVTYRVRTETPSQVELSTPSAAIHPVRRGSYRVSVTEDGNTQITVPSGEVEIFTPKGTERIRAGQMMTLRGTPADPEFQISAAPPRDDWDNWNDQRDQQLDRSTSYRHMSRDISGGEELDANGRWVNDPQYGDVWHPAVSPDWAPYRVGRWAWEDYYGWTWVSGDPWGWAPYHYGNWFNGSLGWCWSPGPIYSHHFWRPALVAFFGFGGGLGAHAGFGFGNVGWVPLAPFERFHPWYGRGYYGGYGRGVANINIVHNTNITNVYRNARYGVNAVNAQDFTSGRFHNVMRVSGDQVRQAGLMRGALPLAPSSGALRYSDRQTQAIPRSFGEQGRFYSRSQPVASNRVPFAQQQRALQQSNGGQGAGGQSAAGSFGRSSSAGGWNRFGNPGTSAPQAAQGGFGSGRQFGRNGASPPTVPQANSYPQPTQSGGSGNGGWGRFGSPAATPSGGTPRTQQLYGSGSYGSRAPAAVQRNYSVPSQSAPYHSTARQDWDGQSRYAQAGRSAPLQISPPVVRERSAPQQQYSRPNYSSAPRIQSYSAPTSSGRGGGGGGNAAPRSNGSSGSHSNGNSGSGAQNGGHSGNGGGGGHHGR